MSRWMCVWICAMVWTQPAAAIHLWNIELPTMARESRAIVYGEVTGTKSFYDSGRGEVLTEVEMSLMEALKEDTEVKAAARFVIAGGVHEDVEWAGPGLPKLSRGDVAVVFLEKLDGRYWPYGLPLGIFNQTVTSAGKAVLKRDLTDAHVVHMDDTGAEVPVKVNYYGIDGFKQKIREYLGAAPKAEPGLNERYAQSDAVAAGRVTGVRVSLTSDSLVETQVDLKPHQILKGDTRAIWIIRVEGGELPDVKYESYDMPAFVQNGEYLVFLKTTPAGLSPIGSAGAVPGRRRSDGRFEILTPDGRILLLDQVDFGAR